MSPRAQVKRACVCPSRRSLHAATPRTLARRDTGGLGGRDGMARTRERRGRRRHPRAERADWCRDRLLRTTLRHAHRPRSGGKDLLPIKVKVSPGLYERAVVSAELVGEDETKGTEDAVTIAKETPDKTQTEKTESALKDLTQRRCTSATRTWGCATISIAPRDRRPTLSETWKGSGDPLSLAVTAKMLGLNTDDQLALFVAAYGGSRVTGRRSNGSFPSLTPLARSWRL